MNAFDAVMLIETNDEASEEEYIGAMQTLIDTGVVWSLQGHYGRLAVEMIEAGVCQPPAWIGDEDDVHIP
jgi:hypothetical protein